MWVYERKGLYPGLETTMDVIYEGNTKQMVIGWAGKMKTKYWWQNSNDMGLDTTMLKDAHVRILDIIEYPVITDVWNGQFYTIVIIQELDELGSAYDWNEKDENTIDAITREEAIALIKSVGSCNCIPMTKEEEKIYEETFGHKFELRKE